MKSIVFDSYALLAFFDDEEGADEVATLLSEVSEGKLEAFISAINMGEIYYITARKKGEVKAEAALHAVLHFPIAIVEPDYHFCIEAARIKAKHKMSYADAFAAALTKKKKATLITGDKEFNVLDKDIKIRFIK
ncbi:MAG: type II toxin-antitoxin system VapC family toxin [Chitinophagales bacterium]